MRSSCEREHLSLSKVCAMGTEKFKLIEGA